MCHNGYPVSSARSDDVTTTVRNTTDFERQNLLFYLYKMIVLSARTGGRIAKHNTENNFDISLVLYAVQVDSQARVVGHKRYLQHYKREGMKQ